MRGSRRDSWPVSDRVAPATGQPAAGWVSESIAFIAVSCGELDRQTLQAPDTREDAKAKFSGEPGLLDALGDQMQALFNLCAGDVLAQTHVHAATKGHVSVGGRAFGVQIIWVRNRRRIPARDRSEER